MSTNVPVSRATNAYELLGEIAALILEDPRRYRQRRWKVPIGSVDPIARPACQTVCCVAGWIDVLKNPSPILPERITHGNPWIGELSNIAEFARSVLGISVEQAEQLFAGDAAGDGFDDVFDAGCPEAYSLIREHAERGAAHIRTFMRWHENQLKAKRV